MGRTIRIFVPLLLAGLPGVAAAQTVLLLPSTAWQRESDGDRCRISRVFGEGDARHILMLDRMAPGDRVHVTLAGPAIADFTDETRAELDLADAAPPVRVSPLPGEVDGFGAGLKLSGIDLAPRGAEASGAEDVVTLAQRGQRLRLQTGALGEVVAALDDCARGLAASWGLDVARLDDLTSGPRLLNGAAVRRGIGNSFAEHWRWYSHTDGIAHVRVIVNEAGQPEDCTVVYGTTGAAPNDRACRIMRKARFAPALDDEGKPVRAAYTASFKDRRRNALTLGTGPTD